MIWQDIVMMAANIIFVVSLVPQISKGFRQKKGFISVFTSLPTAIGLFMVAYALYTLGLYLSSAITLVSALLWLTLFIQKIAYKNA